MADIVSAGVCRKHVEKDFLRFIKHMAFAVFSFFPFASPEECINIEMVFTLSADAWVFNMALKACAK